MKEHDKNCPRLQFWDGGEWQVFCLCKPDSRIKTILLAILTDPIYLGAIIGCAVSMALAIAIWIGGR